MVRLFLEYVCEYRNVSYGCDGGVIALKISLEWHIIRSDALRGSRETACKQNFGNFRFSASRVSVRMKVIPLESYELAVFYGVISTTFGVLLKLCVWSPSILFPGFA